MRSLSTHRPRLWLGLTLALALAPAALATGCSDAATPPIDLAYLFADLPTPDAGTPDLPVADSLPPADVASADAPPPVDVVADLPPDGPPVGPPLPSGINAETISAAGLTRDVLLLVPEGDEPMPVIFAFHPQGDAPDSFTDYSGLADLAGRRGIIVIGAQGVGNARNQPDWDAYTEPVTDNADAQLLEAMRARAVGASNVDPTRLYLLGYSAGGFFTYFAAMSYADRFAAAHIHAAFDPLAPDRNLHLDAARPIPVDLIVGTEDSFLDGARFTRDELEAVDWPLRYSEVQGAGHIPFRTERLADILEWLMQYTLP